MFNLSRKSWYILPAPCLLAQPGRLITLFYGLTCNKVIRLELSWIAPSTKVKQPQLENDKSTFE